MTDSSVCIILVSIHWKLANQSGGCYKAREMAAIEVAKPQNYLKSLCILVLRGLFPQSGRVRHSNAVEDAQWVSLRSEFSL
jgi:hypothetical protein